MTDTVQNDVIRATAKLVDSVSGAIQNVFWYKLATSTPLTNTEVAEDVRAFVEEIYDNLYQSMPDTTAFDSINLFNITQDFPLGDYDWPTLGAGTQSGDAMPSPCSVFCFARTGLSRIIGRKFFAPFMEVSQADGIWTAGLPATVAAAVDDWIEEDKTGTNGNWKSGLWSVTKQAFYVFLEGVVRYVVAYQRRRKQGVGS